MSYLEKEVQAELISKGYPICYKNLKIKNGCLNLFEIDIISTDFVIEIKSGRETHSITNQHLSYHKYIPERYVIYYYAPALSDEEIKDLNESNGLRIIYTNTLETIYTNHQPCYEIVIPTQNLFSRFLYLDFPTVKKYNKIYIKYEDFFKQYFINKYLSDYTYNGVSFYKKINYLLKSGKIRMVNEFKDNIPVLIIQNKIPGKMAVEEINFNLNYPIYWNDNKNDVIKVPINGKFPLLDRITYECNCGENHFNDYCCSKIYPKI